MTLPLQPIPGQNNRPEPGFPMPGDTLLGRTVIASVYFTDEIVLVLLLEPKPPFFTVAQYQMHEPTDDVGVVPRPKGSLTHLASEYNIVPAVRAYEENGGDY